MAAKMLPELTRMNPTVLNCAIAISAWVAWSLQTSIPGPIATGILGGWLQGLVGSYCILATVKVEPLLARISKLGLAIAYVGLFEVATISMFVDFPLHYDRFPVLARAMELACVPALFTSAVIWGGFNSTRRIGDLLLATLLVALALVAVKLSGVSDPTPDVHAMVFWYSTVAVTASSMCIFVRRSKRQLIAAATMVCTSIAFVILVAESGTLLMRLLACVVQFAVINAILWQNSFGNSFSIGRGDASRGSDSGFNRSEIYKSER